MLFKRNNTPAFGIDIGDVMIKLAAVNANANTHILTHAASEIITEPCFENGKITHPKILKKHLLQLLEKGSQPKLRTKFVHSCLPDSQTFIKQISIPMMTDEEIPEAVKWASEHHIPLPAEQSYLDWQIISKDPTKKQINILLGAVPRTISDEYTNILQEVGLIPLSLEIEAIATARAILNPEQPSADEAVVVIDLGATRASFTLFANSTIYLSNNLPFAGQQLTQTIAKTLSLAVEQAEAAKKTVGFDPQAVDGGIHAILKNSVDSLTEAVQLSIQHYQNNAEQPKPINTIYLIGGGANLQQLPSYLSKSLKLDVQLGNALLHCEKTKKIRATEALSFATAIGLALKAYE